MPGVNWVLESYVFPNSHQTIREAILRSGHRIIDWNESWITNGAPEFLSNEPTVFHGSLGNAAFVNDHFNWAPGSFCDVERFRCSSWYDENSKWLLHREYTFTTVASLVEDSKQVADSIGARGFIFVRPDSPLKPFSGRVLETENLRARDLDYGFYYDDLQLRIVVAPIVTVGREWRFVVANGIVISGSGYDPKTRTATLTGLDEEVTRFAERIALESHSLGDVYVLDVCECENEFRLVEFNPFGGADLYNCDPKSVVEAVSNVELNRK